MLEAFCSVMASTGAASILATIEVAYPLMASPILVQSCLALSFLGFWEKETPKETFLSISSRSFLMVARRDDCGFFLTSAALALAASLAAISASDGVSGLSSGRV